MAQPSFASRAKEIVLKGLVRAFGEQTVAGMLFPNWRSGPRLGSAAMLKAYGVMPWLRAVEQKISQDVASLTWQVLVPIGTRRNRFGRPVAIRDPMLQRASRYEDRAARLNIYAKQERLREIPDHPLLDVLSAGTPWFSGHTSMGLTQTHLDLVGEMAWLLDVNGYDMPTGIVPIPPTWVQTLAQDNEGVYRISGPGSAYDVPASRMVFRHHPDPASPFRRGSGLAQVLGDELETDEAAAKYTKDWFKNRAIPPVLIAGLGQHIDELKRLEEKWLSKYQRSGSGWLPHFLNAKVDVHQLSQTFEQQQLGPLRKNERDIVFQVYGMPPEQMGVLENANRSTIDASDYIYNRRLVMSRAEFLRGVIQDSLAARYDERLVIHYVSPVKEDLEFALKVRQAAPWAWMQDEWREFGGSEALPAGRGKVFMVPVNLIPMETIEPPPEITVTEVPPALPPLATPGEQPDQIPETPSGRSVKLLGPAKAGDDRIRRATAAVRWQVLERHGKPIIRAMVADFGQDAIADAGFEIDFNLRDPAVEEHLRGWGADRMGDTVNETTKAKIGKALADVIEAGGTQADMVAAVREVVDVRVGQAEAIAQTETTRSSNFAWVEGMRQAGLEKKEWLSTEDSHVRNGPKASHVKLDGQVVGIDENFVDPVSLAEGPYPGGFGIAAEDVNCRCGVITVIAQRRAMSVEQRSALWKTLETERAPYVKRLGAALATAFREQGRAVIAALGGGEESLVDAMRRNHEETFDRVLGTLETWAARPAPAAPVVQVTQPAQAVSVQIPERYEQVVTVKVPPRIRRVERDGDGRIVRFVDEDDPAGETEEEGRCPAS